MNEIKFRAWNKVDKTMYTDAINNCKDSFDMVLKHPQIYEVMQYTGLKDKNGNEIYEGDILWDALDEVHYQIEFQDGCFRYHGDGLVQDLFENCDGMEVIGNIYYEKPELLVVINEYNPSLEVLD